MFRPMKSPFRYLSVVLIAAILLAPMMTLRAEPVSESTDFTGYTEIATKQDLNNIRNDLSGKYVLTADIEFTAKDFQQGGLFYNGGSRWRPIGKNEKEPFTGVLDGNGHSIKGLTIQHYIYDNQYAGLFGYIQGATIQNLTMLDTKIDVKVNSDKDKYLKVVAGSIAGYAVDSSIINCFTTGTIKANAHNEFLQHKEVSCYAGGIAGLVKNTTVRDCSNTATVSTVASTKYPSGSTVTGGIVGYAFPGSLLERCCNAGCVSSTVTCNESMSGAYPDTGGIVGCSDGADIIDCRNSGNVSTTATTTNIGSYVYVGGIAGSFYNGTIRNCANTGNVQASASETKSLGVVCAHVGGIAATTGSETSIINCYNTGNLTAKTSASKPISAVTYACGIVGDYIQKMIAIENCYNIGKTSISYPSSGYYSSSIGGCSASIAQSGGEVNVANCYYLDSASNIVGYGSACTADAMKLQETYTGFDFNTIWQMDTAAKYPYPTLLSLVDVSAHVHEWSEKWTTDENAHWHECTANDCTILSYQQMNGYGAHTPEADDSNCATAIKCSECKMVLEKGQGHNFDNNCDTTCNNEGCTHTREITHTPEADDGDCTTAIKCSVCGETVVDAKDAHTYTDEEDNLCDICEYDRSAKDTGAEDDSSGGSGGGSGAVGAVVGTVLGLGAIGAGVFLYKKKWLPGK